MPLPSKSELELPIRNPPASGPAVDLLERRKEKNDNAPFTAEKLATNFAAVRDAVIKKLRKIIADAHA